MAIHRRRRSRRRRRGNPDAAFAGVTPGGGRVRYRYHYGPPFFIYIFITLLVALGAFNSQNNLLFWAFGFALAVIIVSGVISGAMFARLRIVRELPARAVAGKPCQIRYRLVNRNRLVPAFGIAINELAEPFSGSSLRGLRPRARTQATWADHLDPPRSFAVHVGAGQELECLSAAPARRRGRAVFTGVRLTSTFPFGLMRKSIEIELPGVLVVRPEEVTLRPDLLRRTDRTGELGPPSRFAGPGEEFFALREYAVGDSPRAVAWRASAKLLAAGGGLLVKQTAAPAPLRVWIVLRLRVIEPGERDPTMPDRPDEQAISVAASLAALLHAQGLEVGIAVPLTGLFHGPQRGVNHAESIISDLSVLDLGPADGRGRRMGFPSPAASRGALCAVIHAGPADDAFAADQRRTVHISAPEAVSGARAVAPTTGAPRNPRPASSRRPEPMLTR